jgi:hypothetical protein
MLSLLDLELGVWVKLRNGEHVLIRKFRRTDGDALYEFSPRGCHQRAENFTPLSLWTGIWWTSL